MLMRFYVSGWAPGGPEMLAMLPAGFGWWFLMFSSGVDLPSWLRWGWGVAGVALGAWSVRLMRRVWLARFYGGPAFQIGRAKMGRRLTDLSQAERARRLEELKALRAARQAAETEPRAGG